MDPDGQGAPPSSAPQGEEAAQSASQGEEAAQSASQGGPPIASGEQAPETPASRSDFSLEEKLDVTHKRALKSGAKKALKDLSEQWGMPVEEASKIIAKHKKAQSAQHADSSGEIDYRKAFTELRDSHTALERQNKTMETAMGKLSIRAEHAKSAKVKALYLQAGAVPQYCDDLVALTIGSFDWSDDGDLEVVERKNGEITPSRLSVDAYVKKMAKSKDNFFLSTAKSGSGSDTSQSSSGPQSATTARRKAFDPRKKLAESRGK